MKAGCRLDVVNRPDPRNSRYLTVAIPLGEEVLAAVRLLWGQTIQQADAAIIKALLDLFSA